MEKYSIGIDFGTLSARAVLVNVKNGKILSESEFIYPHGVIEESMPDGTLLPEGFSLQHPEDYLDALKKVIPELLKKIADSWNRNRFYIFYHAVCFRKWDTIVFSARI